MTLTVALRADAVIMVCTSHFWYGHVLCQQLVHQLVHQLIHQLTNCPWWPSNSRLTVV